MDSIARLVADAFDLETPPAKGSDIVVGQECAATNRREQEKINNYGTTTYIQIIAESCLLCVIIYIQKNGGMGGDG